MMRGLSVKHLSLVWVVALGGCASVVVSGKTLDGSSWDKDVAVLRARVPAELGCAFDQVTLDVVDDFNGSRVASQIGVKGCGKSAFYVRAAPGMPLVLNSRQ